MNLTTVSWRLCLAASLASGSEVRLVIPFYGPNEIALADKYLHKGDIMVFYPPAPELKDSGLPHEPGFWIQKVKEFKATHPNVEVLFNFDSIKEIREWSPKLPREVNWLSYDYERWETTPEYSSDQQQSLQYFREASRVVHQHHQRLFLTPIPMFNAYFMDFAVKVKYLPDKAPLWNLAPVARAGDALNVQFQYFLRDLLWLESDVRGMAVEMKQKAPKVTLFIQVGPAGSGKVYSDEELKNAMKVIQKAGAGGITVWYGPKQDPAWGAKVLAMLRGKP